MKEAKTMFVITVLLLSLSCLTIAQDPEVELLIGMRTIMDQLNRLTIQFEDLQTEMRTITESQKTVENIGHLQTEMSTIKDLQTEMRTIKESQKTVEENIGQLVNKLSLIEAQVDEIEKCATREQVNAFKTTFIAEQEIVKHTSQQCFTKQDMITFEDILKINECAELTHNCSALATCSDSFLHYICYCNPGYSGDGFTCQDINECIEEPNVCGDNWLCVNHPGNYSCTCPAGFQIEGTTCVYNCASPSKVISDLGCVIPVTMTMSWDEAQETCHRKGGRLLEGLRQEHLEPLGQHFRSYLNSNYAQIGLRGGIYVKSRLPVSSEDDIWKGGYPQGSAQDTNDCGQVYLNVNSDTRHIIDFDCSNKESVLCQIL